MSRKEQNVVFLQTEPEVPLPPKFNGARTNSASDFKDSMDRIFFLQPRRFPTDDIKIIYLSSFFTDAAKLWYQALHGANSPCLQSVDSFWPVFMNRFGNPLASEDQKIKLLSCRQGKFEPIEDFNSRFLTLTLNINFNDEALRCMYIQAIGADTLEKLYDQEHVPISLADTMSICEMIESRRRQINKRRNLFSDRRNMFSTSRGTPDPMNNALTKAKNEIPLLPTAQDSTERRGPLSDAEKQRRRTSGLCLYCGAADHSIIACPAKNTQARQQDRR